MLNSDQSLVDMNTISDKNTLYSIFIIYHQYEELYAVQMMNPDQSLLEKMIFHMSFVSSFLFNFLLYSSHVNAELRSVIWGSKYYLRHKYPLVHRSFFDDIIFIVNTELYDVS